MTSVTHLPEKLINYISSFIANQERNHSILKDKFHQNFKAIATIFMSSFSVGMVLSILISYIITAQQPTKRLNILANKPSNHTVASVPYSVLQKNILNRNIFNHKGDIPYEDTAEGSENFLSKSFDKTPCATSEKLPVEVIGIIYTGNPKTNLVSLKDPQVMLADVYQEGQTIIDNEGYSLYKVTGPDTAEFKRDNKKICVSLNPQNSTLNNKPSTGLQDGENVSLDSSFVTQQLGPGFSTILNSARLVPQIIDGKMMGFKIFSIAKDSLFDKIKLMNGDVIKNINGIDLEDASQGFKVYEAFQDENNITLKINRNGELLNKRVTVQ